MKTNNNKKMKSKMKNKKKMRLSVKTKLTLSYISMFMMISLLSTFSIIYLFKIKLPNLEKNVYIVLLVIIALVKVLEIIINAGYSYKIAKKSLKPVDLMISEVKEISINDLNKRLDVSGVNNEFKDLAITFNDMLDELQIAIESQNQFVSDASHELRTPISVIQGYANLMSRWGKDDKDVLEESINAIKEEAESMKKLINSLLFLARGDRNKQIIEKNIFSLKELIDEIVRETILIDDNHVIINTINQDVNFNGDRNLIKEAIRIFIDNSIKYTKDGGSIKINTFRSKNGVYIVIEDDGIGMKEEDIPNIFKRFYRSDESRNKQSGGSGLGLSIAKYIIDGHDGKVKVYSKPDEGTIMSIELKTD